MQLRMSSSVISRIWLCLLSVSLAVLISSSAFAEDPDPAQNDDPTTTSSPSSSSLFTSKMTFFLPVVASNAAVQPNEPVIDPHTLDDYALAELARQRNEPPFQIDEAAAAATGPLNQVGQWGSVTNWPFAFASAASLPDGRIAVWGANNVRSFNGGSFTYSSIWDPATGQFLSRNRSGHSMFCAIPTMMEDGRVFVNGGDGNSPLTSIFDYRTNQWSSSDTMSTGRWYPGSVMLPGDKAFTLLGRPGGPYPEIWTQENGWSLLTGANLNNGVLNYSGYQSTWLPYLHLMPNGNIFHTGPTTQMNIINPTGNGSISSAGLTNSWYPKYSVGIMYDEGKLLVAGGAASSSSSAPGTDRAMVIDFSGTTPTKTNIASMNYARKFNSGVVLPNGEVLIIGGNTSGVEFSDQGSILAGEIWNPTTQSWREVANMSVPRNYHSVALLMPDGRVWSGGGGLCNCSADHMNHQIYSPPYLFNANGSLATRPTITSAPDTAGYGATFNVQASANIQKFSLIKMSGVTHNLNSDLRFLNVNFNTISSGNYQLTLHSNPNVLTPGYWMLFAINNQGVPSVSKVIQVVSSGAPQITPLANQTNDVDASVSLQIEASDPNGDSLSYSATGLPTGLNINSGSGLITGSPTTTGVYNVTITVDDGQSAHVSIDFTWIIALPGGGSGQILREWWTGISGTSVANLTGNSRYPNSPSGSDMLTSFEAPSDWLDNYGTRVHGYLYAPVTGQYRFWIATDDNGQLWLSSNDEPANAVQIASVPGWASPRQWDKYSEQRSALITLQAGQKYYISALQKEGGGLDNLAVAWQIPGGNQEVIPGNRLSPFGVNQPPVVTNPGAQSDPVGATIALTMSASDPDGDTLAFSATGLPTGLSINGGSGQINGTLSAAGSYNVTVSVNDGNGDTDSTSFTWTVYAGLALSPITSSAQPTGTDVDYTASFSGGANPRFRWLFGDGTAETSYSTSPSTSHTYSQPGRYIVTLTATDDGGQEVTTQFPQLIHRPLTAQPPAVSMSIIYETRAGNDRVWNVNPDNDTVSVSDAVTRQKVAEIGVGSGPRALAIAPNGRVWVTNKHDATISMIDAGSLNVVQTVSLPFASQPYGIAFAPDASSAFVALEAVGTLLKLNPTTGAQTGSANVGPTPRHLSILANSSRVYVSRFISPLTPGEETANPQLTAGGGEVVVVNSANMSVVETITLQYGDRPDTEANGRGIPNYLGPAVISPDGSEAWLPSKQDNIARGVQRDGQNLNHEHTLRSITSYIDLGTNQEEFDHRVDHDNGGIASSGQFERYGAFLFVALEGSREVAVIDTYARGEIFRIDVGRAPQGIAVSPDGLTLFVHNFMDRSIGLYDLSDLVIQGESSVNELATIDVVANEALTSQVLLGKQIFYDSKDSRLARDAYISCAGCHNDGGQDGRVWDMTGFGEGLRNTIDLNGHAGMGQGPLHWSENFDEVQDFENQIRNLSGGTGLMSESDFAATQPTLGTPKAGRSAELDALAAYVSSLTEFDVSPHRNANGSLTTTGEAGRALFQANNCASCHAGQGFTDSAPNNLHDIGTLKPTSGSRLGASLTGIDTPTLRGVWSTAPYLHDGSAATLVNAVAAHNNITLSSGELAQLAAYLNQIDANEPAPAANQPPVLTNPGAQNSTVGDGVTLALNASDADGDTLSYSATGLPNGLAMNSTSGVIAGTTTTAGNFNVTVTVSDGNGGSDSAAFAWAVNAPANQPPVLTNPGAQNSTVGDGVTLALNASDPDGDTLSYSATGLPNGLSMNSTSGTIAGTTTTAGNFNVTVTVSDGNGGSDSTSFAWAVNAPANQPPVLTNPGVQSNTVGDGVTLALSASDPDGDTLSYSATGLPNGLSMNSTSGTIAGTTTTAGNFNVTVTVSDGNGGSDSTSFAWSVTGEAGSNSYRYVRLVADSEINNNPWSSAAEFNVLDANGVPLSRSGWTISADSEETVGEDGRAINVLDGNPETIWHTAWLFSSPTHPHQMVIDMGTAQTLGGFRYLPPQVGSINGTIIGYKFYGSLNGTNWALLVEGQFAADSTEKSVTLTGGSANRAPVINPPGSQSSTVGNSVTLALSASDADGDSLSYSASGLPNGLSMNSTSGVIAGTTTTAGSFNVTVTVSDGNGGSDSTSFPWSVSTPANQPPVITNPGAQSSTVGDGITLALSASDANGDSLSYSASGLPNGLSMNSTSGVIAGTATTAGSFNVTVTVNDGNGGTDSASFLWSVTSPGGGTSWRYVKFTATSEINDNPWASAAELYLLDESGNQLNRTGWSVTTDSQETTGEDGRAVNALDGDVNSFWHSQWLFASPSHPHWLQIDLGSPTAVGGLRYLPIQVGSVNGTVVGYTISLSNDAVNWTLAAQGEFAHNQNAKTVLFGTPSGNNQAPVLTNPGPRSNQVGNSVNLPISASDADGDPLSFSASGLPAGLTMSSGGTVSGSTTTAGTYNVTLTVNDGNGGTDNAVFTWTVHATQASSCDGLVREAEGATLSGGFVIGNDAAASGGQYVHVVQGTGDALNGPAAPHKLDYCFTVTQAGLYRIQGWVFAPSGNDDSFFVQVDGAPTNGYLWDTNINFNYAADFVNHRNVADPVEVNLAAGQHTVSIFLREDGARLDKLALVPATQVAAAGESSIRRFDALALHGQVSWTGAQATASGRLNALMLTLVDAETGGDVYAWQARLNATGKYYFDRMPVGDYLLSVILPDGLSVVGPSAVRVTVSESGLVEHNVVLTDGKAYMLYLPTVTR